MNKKILFSIGILCIAAAIWIILNWNRGGNSAKTKNAPNSIGHTVVDLGQPAFTSEKADAKNDDWPTEVVHDTIKKQLAKLSASIEAGKPTDSVLSVTSSFSAEQVRDDHLRTVFEDDQLVVQRTSAQVPLIQIDRLRLFLSSFGVDLGCKQFAVKVISIDSDQQQTTARLLTEAKIEAQQQLQQITATWKGVWKRTGDQLLFDSATFEQFEKTSLKSNQPLFQDVTRAALKTVSGFEPQFLRSTTFWSQRLSSVDDMHIFGHNGIAVGDVNNDGLDDLYVCDSGGLPNRLLLQNADGTVTDFSDSSEANWLESSSSALLVDLDQDGDQDLVCATVAAVLFAENNGKGVFKIKNAFRDVPEAHSMCAADYDNDGDIDIYICNYGPSGSPGSQRGFEAALPVPYDDANNGGPNVLLSNAGKFQFKNVTDQVGLSENNRRFSFAASWQDFDLDGDVDLYVANDFGRNSLYRNDQGKFKDISSTAGVEDTAAGMSVSWGDFNRDGRPDLYVGNMFSSAGNRVTYQRKFTNRYSDRSSSFQRMARGNTLFQANQDGSFSDATEMSAVNMGRWAWSSKFADLNNDGWQDIVVANGYFTNERTDDL